MRADTNPKLSAGQNRSTLLAYILGVILTGGNAVAVRFTVAELAPFWGAALRFCGAALIFWVIVLLRRTSLPAARVTRSLVIYGLLNFGVGYALIYWGLKNVPAGLAQVVLALAPLLTFLFAVLHGLESFRWRGLAGAVVAVAGIAWAFFKEPAQGVALLPLLAVVAGAACFAEATVLLKRTATADPLVINAVGMTAGTVLLIVLSLAVGETWSLPARMTTWLSTIYLVIIGSVSVFYLYTFVVKRWSASAASYEFVLFPFVTVFIAAWLAGEMVNAAFLLGGALVLLGVWIGAFSASAHLRLSRAAPPKPAEAD